MPQYCRHPILPMLKFSDLRKEHPDVSKLPDAKQRWQELSAAYDALSDPETCLGMILVLGGGCWCWCWCCSCLMIGSWKGQKTELKRGLMNWFQLDLVGFRIVDFGFTWFHGQQVLKTKESYDVIRNNHTVALEWLNWIGRSVYDRFASKCCESKEKLKAWERAQRGASAGTRSRTRTTGQLVNLIFVAT